MGLNDAVRTAARALLVTLLEERVRDADELVHEHGGVQVLAIRPLVPDLLAR